MKRIFAAMAMMAFLFSFGKKASAAKLSSQQFHYIQAFILEAASKYYLEPALLRAIIRTESAYNYRATSHAGARGLMQIMPQTAKSLGSVKALDSSNPRANILAGAKLMRQLINQFGGNLKLALAAYNAGPSAVRRYGGIPPFPETQTYVKRVQRFLKQERQKCSLEC